MSLKHFGTALALLTLLFGGAAIAYERWSRPIADGDAAIAAGQLEAAIVSYTLAERRFDTLPSLKEIAQADYDHAVANHLWALYRLGRFDDAIEVAGRAPVRAAPHFFAGASYFQKAQMEEKTDAVLAWLTRAEEELHMAVEAAPTDWDTKYDFELTTRLAAAMRKEPKAPPKQLMQLLRPQPPQNKAGRRVP